MEGVAAPGPGTCIKGASEAHSKHEGKPWKVPETVRRPKELVLGASLDGVSSLGRALWTKERNLTFPHYVMRNH